MQKYNFKEFLQRFTDEPDKTEFVNITSQLPQVSTSGPWICGGALRRTLIKQPLDSDVDFFFRNEEQLNVFCREMEDKAFVKTSINDSCITYNGNIKVVVGDSASKSKNIKVQAILINYYEKIEDAIDSFDFTITQFGWDGKDLYCGDYALWDLARRKLAIHKLTYGISTLRRLIKYSRQGFTACGGVLADMLQKTLENPSTASTETMYVD